MNQRITYLVAKYQTDQLTEDEREELSRLITCEKELVSEQILSMILELDRSEPADVVKVEDGTAMLKRILDVDRPNKSKVISLFSRLRWAVAAAILVLIAFGIYFREKTNEPRYTNFTNDVKPGVNKAILTLANGEKISLSDAKDGEIMKQAGLSITKTESGEIIYKVIEGAGIKANLAMNTINTPQGGQWQVILPDGSKVWLNAISSLTYPASFVSSSVRKVKLVGEAYFEVAKDKAKPFIVQTSTQDVMVFGTHFNINSYADELVTKTVLLEGSVQVKDNRTGFVQMLTPGDQSILSDNGIEVAKVDVDDAVAWKNGYFVFNNERLDAIMRELSRWYNIDVEYANDSVRDVKYYGTVSRFGNISQVLRKLEHTSHVRFDITGSKVVARKTP